MRKEMNLKVEEYVNLFLKVKKQETAEALSRMRNYITTEVRARELTILEPKQEFEFPKEAYRREWNIEGERAEIAIVRRHEP